MPLLPITTRLIGGFAAVLIVTAIAVLTASQQIGALQTTRNHEVGELATYLADLGDAALAAKAMANDERGYLLSGDEKFATEALQRIDAIDKALDQAGEHGGADRQATLAGIRSGIATWVDVVREEFALARTDRDGAVRTASAPAGTPARRTRRGSPRRPPPNATS